MDGRGAGGMSLPFPIVILESGVALPPHGTCYIIAQNGVFLRKHTGIVSATVQVDKISALEKVEPRAELRVPKLPVYLCARALLFFRRVYRLYRSEAVLLLHYNVRDKIFRVSCPEQTVTPTSVSYDARGRFKGFQLIGTIHSHASMPAFHSGTDADDEAYMDGLHITIGHIHTFPVFSVSATIAVNNNRFVRSPQDMLEGLLESTSGAVGQGKKGKSRNGEMPNRRAGRYSAVGETARFHRLCFSQGKDFRNVGVPLAWIDRVTKARFAGVIQNGGNDGGIFPLNDKTAKTERSVQ